MSDHVKETATKIVFSVCLFILIFFSSKIAISKEHEISWAHDGENTKYYQIIGNTRADLSSALLGTVLATERKFIINQPDDCSPIFILVRACNDDQCSDPSAIRMFKVPCPAPQPPLLDGLGSGL